MTSEEKLTLEQLTRLSPIMQMGIGHFGDTIEEVVIDVVGEMLEEGTVTQEHHAQVMEFFGIKLD